jgi:hypothetical protein
MVLRAAPATPRPAASPPQSEWRWRQRLYLHLCLHLFLCKHLCLYLHLRLRPPAMTCRGRGHASCLAPRTATTITTKRLARRGGPYPALVLLLLLLLLPVAVLRPR